MSNVADARMPQKVGFTVNALIMTTTRGGCSSYFTVYTLQVNRGGPATREATDDDIKRCDADGNPRKRTTG
jgi:hypothetical protein